MDKHISNFRELNDSELDFHIVQPARTLSLHLQRGWEACAIPTFNCDIQVVDYDEDENPSGEKVGEVSYSVFDWQVINEAGLDMLTAFDLEGELMPFGEALYDFETNELGAEIDEKLGGVANTNLLCLKRLMIYPKWRGKGLGLAVNRRIMLEYQSQFGIVALKVCPLQFAGGRESEEDKKLYSFKGNKAECTEKLKEYYSHLGFVDTGRDDIMAFNCAYILPMGEKR